MIIGPDCVYCLAIYPDSDTKTIKIRHDYRNEFRLMTIDTNNTDSHHWKERSREHFRRWSEHYDRDIINVLLFRPSYRRVLEKLRHWRRRGENDLSLLDVGCGTGTLIHHCLHLAPHVSTLVGLDMSAEMIDVARRKLAPYARGSRRLELLTGDAEHLPFEDNRFDIITCCNSFHHYPHKIAALKEMKRVLCDGGRLILIDGSPDNWFGYFIFEICVAYIEKHVHHCSSPEFYDLLDRAGFTRIQQHTFGVCPPALINVAEVPKTK